MNLDVYEHLNSPFIYTYQHAYYLKILTRIQLKTYKNYYDSYKNHQKNKTLATGIFTENEVKSIVSACVLL